MTRAIGIDLGTTYTVVATIQDRRPKIIPNANGQHLTPSVVAFTPEGETLVGQPAKCQAAANPERTIFSIKRHMGSSYKVRIDDRYYTPQEISSLILRKVKANAENYLGERISQAVITVPAYFNERQRQATREAGIQAGLEVMRILNEPTATALAYGLEREEVHTVLVWDLGGGTFDISILELGEGIFEVRAVCGDTWLGGDDFDQKLMDYLSEEYKRINGSPFPENRTAWQRLREVAEKAKIQLSSSLATRVSLSFGAGPANPNPLEIELTRAQCNHITDGLLQRLVVPTRQALSDAGLAPQDIQRVILAGGATRMPALRELAKQIFGKAPYRYLNPDEVVAMGAAIYSGMLLGVVKEAVLLDVLPLSLGVETQGGLMARLIHRNTPLPTSASRVFTTAADFQTSMDIHVLQGERELVEDNISLGNFQLQGIPSAARGMAKVEVAFQADVDGIVHVSATDLLTESEVRVKIASTKLLDPQEIDQLAREAILNARQDREKRQRIGASIEAANLIAVGEVALESLDSNQVDIRAQQIGQALAQLKKAVASDTSDNIKTHSNELRQLLELIYKDSLCVTLSRSPERSEGAAKGLGGGEGNYLCGTSPTPDSSVVPTSRDSSE